MVKKVILFLLLVFFSVHGEEITVAVSANAQYAIKDIIQEFRKLHPDTNIKTVVSSSGKLTNQILRGAPFDIFFSADMKYPSFLYKKKIAITKPKVYAYGVLVLWTAKDIPLKNLNILLQVSKIAVANPKNAPYGRESINVLKNTNLYQKVKSKIIYGESIAQVNFYIVKRLVDVGFTSKSSVLSPKLKHTGKWLEIDKSLYNPIKQGVVVLKNGKGKKTVFSFYKFIFSKKAKEIFQKYGYIVKDEQN